MLPSSRVSKKYSKQKTRITRRSKFKEEGSEETLDNFIEPELRKLIRIYLVFRRSYSGKFIPEKLFHSGWGLVHFRTLLKRIHTQEKNTKLKIDLVSYLQAHFRIWGADTYPTHLIGGNSFAIYRKFQERNCPESSINPSDEYKVQLDLLRHLAESRQESSDKTLELLKSSGLFTSKFVECYVGQTEEARIK